MSLKGLRFTLEVDGLAVTATAVVSFRLYQQYSSPFVLEVDIASDLPDLTAMDFLEKNAVLTIWQGSVAQRYVKGLVTSVTLGENNHWQMKYNLTLPYPVTAELSLAVQIVPSVRANGMPVVVLDQSFIPITKGDKAGVATGVQSGTVEGKCYPKEHSKTVRAGKRQIVRHGDKFLMNGK